MPSLTLAAGARRAPWAARAVAQRALLSSTSKIFHAKVAKADSNDQATPITMRSGPNPNLKAKDLHIKMIQTSNKLTPKWEQFPNRHIGPRDEDIKEMLKILGAGVSEMGDLINQAIPDGVLAPPMVSEANTTAIPEEGLRRIFAKWGEKNEKFWHMIGGGYYPVDVPAVIRRNLLENPAWYTSYTPYQAELSQGRLESLINFQTMVSDLTGLPIANSSLLDEGTAAAEAMTMSMASLPASRQKRATKTYVISDTVHSHTIQVMKGRAEGFGITLKLANLNDKASLDTIKNLGDDLVGVMVQYPDKAGSVNDYSQLADVVHAQGALLSAATDLSALTVLKPPGEWGADIAFGNSQRFGVPLGFGGPHAAFMAVKEASKRKMPGRLIGVSKDRLGRKGFRLALQTREQHIRREKATSNVCTAQALLANMAAMYAVYHGPAALKGMAVQGIRNARMLQQIAEHYGFRTATASTDSDQAVLFDTLALLPPKDGPSARELREVLTEQQHITCGLQVIGGEEALVFAIPTNFQPITLLKLAEVFHNFSSENSADQWTDVVSSIWERGIQEKDDSILDSIPDSLRRTTPYLTHPVFNSHHSETEMLRYINHLASKDLSLVHSMIPLGSCTMKLNGTTQMELIGNGNFSNVHPYTPYKSLEGYRHLVKTLSTQLTELTGMDDVSLQPNSGAQGEFAGLQAIRRFHESRSDAKRDICLIPVSAHGTNPASAAMAGMRVVPVKCDTQTGNLDLADLEAKCAKHSHELAAIMITYPSTYGVFEPAVRDVCDMVHQYGGQVYMDGANMNAQIGLTSPGALGADVCHLNLHKTFCIPHGGGGPGVGPICVKEHLSEHLPGKDKDQVASAKFGSASILPISWAYIASMGKLKHTITYFEMT